MASEQAEAREEQLLRDFAHYDEHVDIVSCFEWIFTSPSVERLPATVAHFERFPRISEPNKVRLTPDFTVLFNDGTAIVAEIARIAKHESSVESLCSQLMNYDGISAVPGSASGELVAVQDVSVVQFVHFELGPATVRRVLRERFEEEGHPFKPKRRPTIVQYARNESDYNFQRLGNPENGVLVPSQRDPDIAEYLDTGLKIRGENFTRVKTSRVFMNDPIPPLYLATHLWLRTIPTQFGNASAEVRTTVADLTETIRGEYGYVRVQDIKKALSLLKQAKLANENRDGVWRISRTRIGKAGEREVQKLIATRATKGVTESVPSPKRRAARTAQTNPDQAQLF